MSADAVKAMFVDASIRSAVRTARAAGPDTSNASVLASRAVDRLARKGVLVEFDVVKAEAAAQLRERAHG